MKDDIDELGEKLELLKVKSEIITKESEIEQRKAMIKELKAKYGRNWRKMLGNLKDNESLKQFASVRTRLV